jgi:hypothetical protein
MNITIIKEDNVVVVDGEALNFPLDLEEYIWAVQWNGTTGEIEFSDDTPNQEITDFTRFQYLVDAFTTEKQRLADEEAQAVIDAEAALTYADKRKAKYAQLNQFEMQFDDQVNGTTTWVDAIKAVKDTYPKPGE